MSAGIASSVLRWSCGYVAGRSDPQGVWLRPATYPQRRPTAINPRSNNVRARRYRGFAQRRVNVLTRL